VSTFSAVLLLSLNPSNIEFSSEKNWEHWESNRGRAGGKCVRYLRVLVTTQVVNEFTLQAVWHSVTWFLEMQTWPAFSTTMCLRMVHWPAWAFRDLMT